VGSNQNLRSVSETEADDAPASERRLGLHASLLALLDMAYGSREGARGAADRALAVAGHDALPDESGDLLVFVLGPLRSVLSAEIGPRLARALVEDFTARLDDQPESERPRLGSSAPPQSMPRAVARVSLRARSSQPAPPERIVLLVDADRVGRASLARALVRARWSVRVVESVEDALDAVRESVPHAVFVDSAHASAVEMVAAVAGAAPRALIVVRGPDGARARACLSAAGDRPEIRPRELSAEELIESVKHLIEE
jgi:hypothetical protein